MIYTHFNEVSQQTYQTLSLHLNVECYITTSLFKRQLSTTLFEPQIPTYNDRECQSGSCMLYFSFPVIIHIILLLKD